MAELFEVVAEIDVSIYDEDAYWDYDAEDVPRSFCDDYEVHEAHYYTAINGTVYECPGLSQADREALEEEANRPPCEHGMSADLCSGPNHY
jgi:hypothetical protein